VNRLFGHIGNGFAPAILLYVGKRIHYHVYELKCSRCGCGAGVFRVPCMLGDSVFATAERLRCVVGGLGRPVQALESV
jgi:hypothetical protein